ncbi:response regulator transcription factor [Streptomyces morookaense]|uniref:response regulator transcription factor n=1 Tax=Streptomyces morookaense TaxID=1970 RepID=UPI0033D267EB
MSIRVLVVDDDALVRAGLKSMLESAGGMEVTVAVGAEALRAAREFEPDVALLDVNMPDVGGIEVLAALRGLDSPPAVAMLTAHGTQAAITAALRNGAAGFLLKDTAPDELVPAVRLLAVGGSALSPRAAHVVVDGFLAAGQRTCTRAAAAGRGAGLTEREEQVLGLVSEGLSNDEIACRLFLSRATVKDHVGAILNKLGAANRVQAAVMAHRAADGTDAPS